MFKFRNGSNPGNTSVDHCEKECRRSAQWYVVIKSKLLSFCGTRSDHCEKNVCAPHPFSQWSDWPINHPFTKPCPSSKNSGIVGVFAGPRPRGAYQALRRPAGHNLPVVELVRVNLIGREHVTHEMVTFTVLSRRRYILYNDLRKWECRSSYFSWLTCTRPEEVRGQREGEIISCRSPKRETRISSVRE
jgi:hypothetical protein